MKVDEMFVKCVLTETIKISPRELNKNYQATILEKLTEKMEGKCTRHGYVKRGSLELIRVQMGQVEAQTFFGYTTFAVKFRVEVCNPSIGMVVVGKVHSINGYGILCMCSYTEAPLGKVDVLHIIIPKQTVTIRSDINLAHIKVGDTVNIEILGKKYELNDSNMKAVGKVVKWTAQKEALSASAMAKYIERNAERVDGDERDDDDADAAYIDDDDLLEAGSESDDDDEEKGGDDGDSDDSGDEEAQGVVDGDDEDAPTRVARKLPDDEEEDLEELEEVEDLDDMEDMEDLEDAYVDED
jgi:DNA-directed RNA polymerase subunit E'/Rpb7